MISKWTKIRIALCGVVLLALGGLVLRRGVQLQVHESAQLREWAERNYLKEIELAPRRGRVLDRNGAELASTVDFDSVYCNPRQLPADAAPKLAKALGVAQGDVDKIVAQRKYFAWLRRRVTPEQSAAVQALKLPGVGVRREPGRVYPNRELGATVLGHASIDGQGLEGVELAYDKLLRGAGVQVVGLRDSYGRELLVDGMIDSAAAAGHDVVLSVDKYLTYVTEAALAGAVKKHSAKAGVAVVMDPRTGEILALASVPTYDPSDPKDASARGARNRAITDEFEPGSTMKTFTFAAALDAGKVRPDEHFDCQMGRMTVGKHTIRDDHPKGILTAAEVFKHSSNVGSVKIARRIGKEALFQALSRFGFGKRTGIGLQGERSGILRPVSRWGEIEFATHAFGQGLTVTPLQLVAGFAAIASGGVYHPPRLVTGVVQPGGQQEEQPRRGTTRVMSESAARTLLGIMQGVTSEGGTATKAAIDGYPVAGKTGTAQKVVNGRYDPDKYVASFIGIVPADRPRLVIGVMIDEPQPIHYGGVVAAPVFKEIGEAGLRYLSVRPSVPMALKKPEAKPAEEDVAEGLGSDLPLEVAQVLHDDGDGGEAIAQDDAKEKVSVPNFAGMSIGEAIRAARRAGVEVVPDGSGVAVAQSPAPGPGPRGSLCRVSFRPGG